MELDIVLPSAHEAEQAALATLLFENPLIQTARAYLRPDDFFSPSHRELYLSMLRLWDREGCVTPALMIPDLKREGLLEFVGSYSYVNGFYDGHVRFTHADSLMPYLRTIREAALQRRIFRWSDLLQSQAIDREPIMQMISKAQVELDAIRTSAALKETNSISEDVEKVLDDLDRIQQTGEVQGVRTGWADLDRIIHGYQRGLLYILAAGSGEGKTTFALQSILRTAKDRKNEQPIIGLVSLEMPRDKIVLRLLQLSSQVSDDLMCGGKMGREDWQAVRGAAKEITSIRIKVADPARSLIEEVQAHVLDLERTFGQVDLMILDFVQLLRSDEAGFEKLNRANQLDQIAYALKNLALRHHFPLIALSQINREAAKRTTRSSNDIRDSSGIVQAADVVLMLTCLNPEDKKERGMVDYELAIDKNRFGRHGVIKLRFSNELGAFGEVLH